MKCGQCIFVEYACPKCDKVFSSGSYLITHSKIHMDDRLTLPCPYENCMRLYYFKRNLNQHIQTVHMGKRFHCDICDINVSSKQKIKEHIIKIHLSEKKPFKRKAPQTRRNAGLPKRSVLSQLTGIQLSQSDELKCMSRIPTALLRDKAAEDSFSEDDRAMIDSVKGA